MQDFSERHGVGPVDVPITVRHDAPAGFREAVVVIASGALVGVPHLTLRDVVCAVLVKAPDRNSRGLDGVSDETLRLVAHCPWHRVYEVAETIYGYLHDTLGHREKAAKFEALLNRYMREHGIGWTMRGGKFDVRGSEAQDEAVEAAERRLRESDLGTAADLLRSANRKLAQRPSADARNAVNDAMNAVEAVTRYYTADKRTFGKLIKSYPTLFPGHLKNVAEHAWIYASQVARHGQEGQKVSTADALLVRGIAVALCGYLQERSASLFD